MSLTSTVTPLTDTHPTLPSTKPVKKSSHSDPSLLPPMYLNTTTPFPTTPSHTHLPSPNGSHPLPPHPTPLALQQTNGTEFYLHNETSTVSGFANSTQDGNPAIITSLVTSLVTNETRTGNLSDVGTPEQAVDDTNTGMSWANVVLITSLSIVIGCFAFTALLLRIGSRVRKARKEAEERRRRRRHALRRNQGNRSPPAPITQIRVRMTNGKKGKGKIATRHQGSPVRAHPNPTIGKLRRGERGEGETSFTTDPGAGKSRTRDALIEIGACSSEVALGKDITATTRDDSFTSETELLGTERKRKKHGESEYDNPVMNVKDPEGEHRGTRRLSTDTETQFTSDTSWNNSPLHFTSGRTGRRASSPEQTSLPSNVGDMRDSVRDGSQESGSTAVDANRRKKLMRMHGRRNSGNNSRDSGYAGGSFMSQDSARNLLAYKDEALRRERFKDSDVRDATPVILEMENETVPLVALQKSESFDMHPHTKYDPYLRSHIKHMPRAPRNDSEQYYTRAVTRVMSMPPERQSYLQSPGLQGSKISNRFNGYPYMFDNYPYCYDDFRLYPPRHQTQSSQHPAFHRTADPIYRLPSPQQYLPSFFPSPSSYAIPARIDDRARFVKRKTASTQTPTDPSTTDSSASSPPTSPSIIRWRRDGRSYVLLPREDLDLDYIGPVYLAESMSESDESLKAEARRAQCPTGDICSQESVCAGTLDDDVESADDKDSTGSQISSGTGNDEKGSEEDALLLNPPFNDMQCDTRL
ncbi:uncharacterized protein [Diadema antillarum]|uniref:uncharacterized protein n=1 Tax=Diadema antillarum TaxID=105358 RepID=UPI003A83F084